jgi:hypothetical protein
MPQSFPHRSAGPPANGSGKLCRRWAPNIPGSLTRSLSRALGVDAISAMRIALLYGDIEWQAGGAALLRYSGSDYARRQGLHRQTVHADIRRLQDIGAITVSYDRCRQAVLELHGLGCLDGFLADEHHLAPCSEEVSGHVDSAPSVARPFRRHRPCLSHRHPCCSRHQPPGDGIDPTLSIRPPTLEKGLKTLEKRREEGNSQQPPHRIREAADQEPSGRSSKPVLSAQSCAPELTAGLRSHAEREQAAQPRAQKASQACSEAKANSHDALLADLLDAFRSAAPVEWPTPTSLTLTPGRRSRLQACLAHAGSHQALVEQLRIALAHVPPWFRTTYPLRPDGSRRPSHQFFDLLFRASAAEREGGPEAWHVFAWSEAAALTPTAAPAMSGSVQPRAASCQAAAAGPATNTGALISGAESDLHRAQRLFGWGGVSWLLRDIEALQIPLAERRRLTALLEIQGQGTAGAGALQFAEPCEPLGDNPEPSDPDKRHRPDSKQRHQS